MPGMQLQQGQRGGGGGGKGSLLPRGWVEGRCQGREGASFLAPPILQRPLLLGSTGARWHITLSRGSPSSGVGICSSPDRARDKCGERGQLLSVSSSSHHRSCELRRLLKEMCTQTPELTALGQLSGPEWWGRGFQPAGAGAGRGTVPGKDENSNHCFCILVTGPRAQTSGPIFLEARILRVGASDELI